MRLVSFTSSATAGDLRTGVLRDDTVVDCTDIVGPAGLRPWLATGQAGLLERLLDTREAAAHLEDVRLLPPIADPGKIVCVGLNYRSHLIETGRPEPEHPTLFTRWADTQMGHRETALLPRETGRFDYEGELAVVIGAHARRVSAEDAHHVVAGYAPYDDFSVRDWQRHTSQFLPGKNFPATGGFGPALVTADEVADLRACELTTRVNGELRQSAPLSDLMFDVPTLIAYVSAFTPLAPGDVIVTGTPGGVGLFRDPPEFLRPGDVVEVSVSGIGTLINPVVAD